jgi:hypothetical protein
MHFGATTGVRWSESDDTHMRLRAVAPEPFAVYPSAFSPSPFPPRLVNIRQTRDPAHGSA